MVKEYSFKPNGLSRTMVLYGVAIYVANDDDE